MNKLAKGQITITTIENSIGFDLNLIPNISTSQEYDSDSNKYFPNYEVDNFEINPSLSSGELLDEISYTINKIPIDNIEGVSQLGNKLIISKNIGDIDLGIDTTDLNVTFAKLESEIQPIISSSGDIPVNYEVLNFTRYYNDQSIEVLNQILKNNVNYRTDGKDAAGKTDAETFMDLEGIIASISGGILTDIGRDLINTEVTKQVELKSWFEGKLTEFNLTTYSYTNCLNLIINLNNIAKSTSGSSVIDPDLWTNQFTTFDRIKNLSKHVIEEFTIGNYYLPGVNIFRNSNSINVFKPYGNSVLEKSKISEFGFDTAYKVTSSGSTPGTYVNLRAVNSLNTPKVGEVNSVSVFMKNNGDEVILLNSNQGGLSSNLTPNESKYIKFENIVGNGVGNLQIQVRSNTEISEVDFTWARIMTTIGPKSFEWAICPVDVYESFVTIEDNFVRFAADSNLSKEEINTINTLWENLKAVKTGIIDSSHDYKKTLTVEAFAKKNNFPLIATLPLVCTSDVGGAPFTVIYNENGTYLTKHDQTILLTAVMYKGSYIQEDVEYIWYKITDSGSVVVSRTNTLDVSAIGSNETSRVYECRTVNDRGVSSSSRTSIGLRLDGYEVRIKASISETIISNVESQTLTADIYYKGLPLPESEITTLRFQWFKLGNNNEQTILAGKTSRTLDISREDPIDSYIVEVYN